MDQNSTSVIDELMVTQKVSQAYQDSTNLVSAMEALTQTNRARLAFTNLQLGSRGLTFFLPNQNNLNEVYLYVQLPPIPVNVRLAESWALTLINNLEVRLGGCSPYQRSQQQLFITIMRECETNKKRRDVLTMMGTEQGVATVGSVGPFARIVLPLPWSSLKSSCVEPGYDTALLNNPIQISFDLATPQQLFYGSGVYPTSLSGGQLYFKEFVFKDAKDMVVRDAMRRDPKAFYSYHFLYDQLFYSAPFAGAQESSGTVATVVLNGFRNATLNSISLVLQPLGDISTANPQLYHKITNLVVNYNGVDILRVQGDDSPIGMSDNIAGENNVDIPYSDPAQVTSPFVTTPVKSYWTVINLAPKDTVAFDGLIQNGLNLSNQNIIITFNTESNSNQQYRIAASFGYNALFLTNQGASEINY